MTERPQMRMSFSHKKRRLQQGYMLLTLMLFVTLLAIASLGWIERVDFQMKRDREQELIHRGVQYSRAIRRYVRKFGRYPARIEDLEKTNNIRYLRKRYKDPITGKDFKLLRQNDVQMSFSPGAASGMAPGAADASSAQGGAPGSLNTNAAAPGGTGVGPASGNPQNEPQQSGDQQSADQQQTADQGQQSADGTNGAQTQGASNGPGAAAGFSAQASPSPNGTPNGIANGSPNGIANGQTFGGLPIVGVASTSKDKTIRVFNKKDRYNQWQFIYDPSTDRGGLLTTPNQPGIQGATQINQMGSQQNANPGQNQGPGFGPGGMNSGNPGQSPGPGSGPGGMNSPNMPPDQPPQNQQ